VQKQNGELKRKTDVIISRNSTNASIEKGEFALLTSSFTSPKVPSPRTCQQTYRREPANKHILFPDPEFWATIHPFLIQFQLRYWLMSF